MFNTAGLDPELLIDPQTKPATEFILDEYVQKMSPRGGHSFAQSWFLRTFYRMAEEAGRGRSGGEWDFFLTLPGESPKQLVPDVAFLSYERVAYEDDEAAQIPRVAPNVAVEILSPGDRRDVRREKIRVYLAAGSELVIFADPEPQTITLFDTAGERRLSGDEVVDHPALHGLRFTVADVFRKPPPPN
jgi:Uma2 family endonuclease